MEKESGKLQKHLRPPWQKGVSGNPKGRPKKAIAVSTLWREFAEVVDPDDSEKRMRIQVLGATLYNLGKAGDIPAARLFLDRAYGTAMIEELPEASGVEKESAEFILYLRGEGRPMMEKFVKWLQKRHDES